MAQKTNALTMEERVGVVTELLNSSGSRLSEDFKQNLYLNALEFQGVGTKADQVGLLKLGLTRVINRELEKKEEVRMERPIGLIIEGSLTDIMKEPEILDLVSLMRQIL